MRNLNTILVSIMGFFNLGLYYKKSFIRKKESFLLFIENLLKGKSAEITLCNADGADGFYYNEKKKH